MNQLPEIPDKQHFTEIAERFFEDPTLDSIKTLPGGHIHRTHAVYLTENGQKKSFIFQCLNTQVFPEPDLIMENILKISEHLHDSTTNHGDSAYQLHILHPVLSKNSQPGIRMNGGFWRVFPFFENALCIDTATEVQTAFSAGKAFGHFFRFLSDMDANQLAETLPGFHSGTQRVQQFREACESDPKGRKDGIKPFLKEIEDHIQVLHEFDRLKESMPLRVIHHDAKLNNVLLDCHDQSPVAVIDLDTVMGGSILSDFGDLVRSLTCVVPEDTTPGTAMVIEIPFFKALLRGFLGECGSILEESEKKNLVFGAQAITFMVAIRFITDYLNGDNYFQTSYPKHNLERARNQMALFMALKERSNEMNHLVLAYFEGGSGLGA